MFALMLIALLLQGPRDIQLENVKPKAPIVIAKGTVIPVELLNRLSTKNLEGGENIYTRTIFPVTINNEIVIPVGTNIQGKIQAVERPGKVKGKASLTLSFQTMILPNGVTVPIYGGLGGSDEGHREGENTVKGESTTGKDAGDIAKAGAGGGVVGAVVRGDRRGAAVGAGIGAGIGLASVLMTRGEDLTLPKGTALEVVLEENLEL
jgi:type IV secretion system protein VirB10